MITGEDQLEALRDSRRHWERMKTKWGYGKDRPYDWQCACCLLAPTWNCAGCPIKAYTRKMHCKGTPYDAANFAFFGKDRKQWEVAAQEEIDFIDKVIVWVEAGKPKRKDNSNDIN